MDKTKSKIKLDPRNARTHSDEQKESLGKSLDELGVGRSIVIDREGNIIGGNAVYEQAKAKGIPIREVETKGDELVVVRRVDLKTDDPRRKALALADNQIATLAGWDEPVLEEIKLEIEDINLDELGFAELEPIPERTDYSGVIERFDEATKGRAKGDEKWFYIEFYGDEKRWNKMKELLTPFLKGQSKHELDDDLFFDMVEGHLGSSDNNGAT